MTDNQQNGQHKARQQRVDVALRRSQAVRLRSAGASFQEIADQLGFRDRSGAYRAVATGLRSVLVENVDLLRTLDSARLDELQLAL